MPRKKENNTSPLPGFDIFGQELAESDRGVLLKPHYRRKQLAGFVPLWNEFFRCYHLAGVSPTSAYLWAYLRQYEHERREWNAISDISWPGRRDMAEALGVSISHLPNLLNELRQAGLISFQPVLPGFEDLAVSLNTTVEEVRDRAADYGVSPKVDGTLYRTADPFTKTEFALLTNLKFCKGCKAYRYCEGVKEARTRHEEFSQLTGGAYTPAIATGPSRPLPAPDKGRKIRFEPEQELNPVVSVAVSQRIQERTVSVSKKERPALSNRIGGRIEEKTDSVFKKIQPVNPSRVKTSKNKPTELIQPEKITTMLPAMAEPARKNLVVVKSGKKDLEEVNITKQIELPDVDLLVRFGFDANIARQLVETAAAYGKEAGYIERIIRYTRENARQNPQGMVRRLIGRGEERLSRSDRWQQQSLFEVPSGRTVETESSEIVVETAPVTDFGELQTRAQAQLAQAYGAEVEDVAWWNDVVAQMERNGYQTAAEVFRASLGLRQPGGKLLLVVRSLFDQHRAMTYSAQLERAVASLTGQLPWLEFVTCPTG